MSIVTFVRDVLAEALTLQRVMTRLHPYLGR